VVDRLGEWEPQITEEQLRSILRTALQYYAQGPDRQDIQDSVASIKEQLSRSQRLIILDDLITIARSDGDITNQEKDVLENLSSVWHIDVRIAY
jgi:uncharacterized tellurite resistance protein B-like protein